MSELERQLVEAFEGQPLRFDLHGVVRALVSCALACEKIADPRKRHKEPDHYTTLGCVMNIAEEAVSSLEESLKEQP